MVTLHPRGRQVLSPRQDDEFALERFHPRLEFFRGDLGVGRDMMKCLVLENGPFSSELTSCLRGRLLFDAWKVREHLGKWIIGGIWLVLLVR